MAEFGPASSTHIPPRVLREGPGRIACRRARPREPLSAAAYEALKRLNFMQRLPTAHGRNNADRYEAQQRQSVPTSSLDRCPFVHRTAVIHSNGDMPTPVPFAATAGNVRTRRHRGLRLERARSQQRPPLDGHARRMGAVPLLLVPGRARYVSRRGGSKPGSDSTSNPARCSRRAQWDFREYEK